MSRANFSLLLVSLLALSTTIFVVVPGATTNARFSPGVVFEVETTYRDGSKSKWELVVEGKNSAIRGSAMERIFLVRGDGPGSGTFAGVDHVLHEYYIVDDSWARDLAARRAAYRRNIESTIRMLPKKQREEMEKALRQADLEAGKKIPPVREIKKTAERAVKAGYPCAKFEVFEDGRKIRELWVTDWSKIDGGDEAAKAFLARSVFVESVRRELPPGAEDPFAEEPPFEEKDFVYGFPVVLKIFAEDDGNVVNETWLRKTRRQSIDPAKFEPPAGYKRRFEPYVYQIRDM